MIDSLMLLIILAVLLLVAGYFVMTYTRLQSL